MKKIRTEGFVAASAVLASAIILIAILFSYSALFSHPGKAEAATLVIYLTSGSSWTVPADWDSSNNKIEVIGGGAGGGGGKSGVRGGGGGGGGAYSKITNLSLTGGNSVTYSIGAAGSGGVFGAGGGTNGSDGGDTWFNGASLAASSVGAKGGVHGNGATNIASAGGAGGAAASGLPAAAACTPANPSVRCNGGNGGNGDGPDSNGFAGGGGGGGAAGKNGAGNNGTNSTTGVDGPAGFGGRGDAASGGAGGGQGVAGGNGTEYDASHGSGGGGGSEGGFNGAVGGLYGGGGGGGGDSGAGGVGKQGLIVITYTQMAVPGTPGTPTFTSVTQTTMTVNWTAPIGGGAVTLYRVQRCVTSSCVFADAGTSGGLSFNDSGLTANTSYTYQVRGENAGGPGPYSSTAAQTTASAIPTVTTSAPASITSNSATLIGSITATGGANATVRGFAYSTTANLAGSVSTTTENGSFGVAGFTAGASSLTPNTTYYVRAYATGPGGSGYGSIVSFTTAIAIPTMTTSAASSITSTTATFNGNITAVGSANPTVRGFAIGTTATLTGGSVSTTTENGSFGAGAYTYNSSSLIANTTYYVRAYSTNPSGTGYGTIQSFTTLVAPPTVVTAAASSIAKTTATLNGNITATGGANATVRGFAIGTTATLTGGSVSTTTENGSFGVAAFTNNSSGLTANTTYYVRAYATNPGGTGYGTTQNFTTLADSPTTAPGTPTFPSFNANSITVNWTAATGATTYNIERCVGSGCSNFTSYATGIIPLSFLDSGLNANTTYAYRIIGVNSGGPGPTSPSAAQVTSQTGTFVPITGWLWSDTIGWISTDCSTGGPTTNNPSVNICGSGPNQVTYGLKVNTSDGSLSGYAWSDNIGWVSGNASDMAGCPSGSCSATLTSSVLTGWLKAVSGGVISDSQNGGWDGFIALDDKIPADGINYGVTYSIGNFGVCDATHSNCAWGGDASSKRGPGWVDFFLAHSEYLACTPSTVCGCINSQRIVATTTDNSCVPVVTYTDVTAPQFCSPGICVPLWPQPTDQPTSTTTGKLSAKPNIVAKNATTTLYWAVNNVTACQVRNNASSTVIWNGAFSATSTGCAAHFSTGCSTFPITQQTIFTLTCTALDGVTTYQEAATVNLLPDFQEK